MFENPRNKNYKKNTEENMETISKEVEKMIKEDVNPHPHNFVSIVNGHKFPMTNKEVLEIPGIFKSNESIYANTNDGKLIFLDQLIRLYPDGEKVIRELASNIEYHIGILSPAKKGTLLDYNISVESMFKIPCFHVVATDYDYGTDKECMIVDGSAILVLYRLFDEKRLYETLNRLSNIDYTKQAMTEYDFIEWTHCIAFAKGDYAKDYLEKSAEFFTRIEKIDYEYQKCLHLSLKVMIKAFFEDEEDVRRLLTMITKAIRIENVENVCGEELFVKKHEAAVNFFKNEVTELKNEVTEMKKEIAEKDEEIAEKDEENLRLKEEIKKLKDQNSNNGN